MKIRGVVTCVAMALVPLLLGSARAEIIENGDFTGAPNPTGWTVSDSSTVGYGWGCAYMAAGSSISQTTSHNAAVGDIYQVAWQGRTDPGSIPPVALEARLYYGAGSVLVVDSESPASNSTYSAYTFSFTVPSDASYVGQPIGLLLTAVSPAGAWANFTGASINVSSVPEPSAIALMTAGLIGLVVYAWRKRS